jgi:hypothetical protein
MWVLPTHRVLSAGGELAPLPGELIARLVLAPQADLDIRPGFDAGIEAGAAAGFGVEARRLLGSRGDDRGGKGERCERNPHGGLRGEAPPIRINARGRVRFG